MAVLVTAIHAFAQDEGVDARDEPAHDETVGSMMMRPQESSDEDTGEAEDVSARLEEAVAKLYAAQVSSTDPNSWLRATRLRHTALAVVAIDVAEAIRELKEEIAELQKESVEITK